jgi:hypothetical protein
MLEQQNWGTSICSRRINKKSSKMQSGQGYINKHFLVEAVVDEKAVGHPDAMRLHGVRRSIVIVSDLGCKETN